MGTPVLPVSESVGQPSRRAALRQFTALAVHLGKIGLVRQFAWALILLLMIPLADTHSGAIQAAYDHARQLFHKGDLIRSLNEAQQGYKLYRNANPELAAKFLLLQTQALIFRGMNDEALRVLSSDPSIFFNREAKIQSLTLGGMAYTYLDRINEANQKFQEASALCKPALYRTCDQVPFRRGVLELRLQKFNEAKQLFLESLLSARAHRDPGTEASALLNLGWTGLQAERYDEAVDWSRLAYRSSVSLGEQDLAESALGNLGWAYYELGDHERALDFTQQAEASAIKVGSIRNQIKWLANLGMFYQESGDTRHAFDTYQRSLALARQINSKQDILVSLEDLTVLSIAARDFDAANGFIAQTNSLIHSGGNRVDELDVLLAQGEIAAAQRQDQLAETDFRTVERDPASQVSMRMGAEHQLAKLYEVQGNAKAAEAAYLASLTTFESARAEIKNEDNTLPFLTNATPIYDDYVRFLVKQGRADEALTRADQSRARTLADGLGLATGPAAKGSLKPAALIATEVARKSGSSILFYWLGKEQSWLWAITPNKTSLFALPAQHEITTLIERYRRALLEPALGRGNANPDGAALYRMLVGPAVGLIPPGGDVVVICDGPLSLLNFETLVVPGASAHYWIEDANVVSAPSLYMLAAAKPPVARRQKLLLMGDAMPPNPDYPRLPMARAEMQKIVQHFASADETVFARDAANSGAYLKSSLRDYAYIHFVAHGVASRTDPLDSAIILSRTGAAEDSFKLHAREIIQHPIDARLVTISACYGGGTRSYAGEGLVGLSWAFLHAGAHNVIGALWEASDDSTPQLMDKMYAGLAAGMGPSSALRQAKLSLLHSEGKFREPFYWAPFQIYAGL